MPSRPPTVSRRRVLLGAAGLVAFGATTVTAAGCGTPAPPPDLDELTTALDRARADSRLATEAAEAARGPVAESLTHVAGQRSAHAGALSDEIVRLTGQAAPTTGATVSTTTSTPASAPPPVPTADDVIGSLRASADSAAQAAGALSGYRAGLLASIAASCTAAYTVALAPGGPS